MLTGRVVVDLTDAEPDQRSARLDCLAELPDGFRVDLEVDAIPTSILKGIVETAITGLIDEDAYQTTMLVEDSEREGLLAMTQGWDK